MERKDVCIKTYWSKQDFADVVQEAEKVGIRARGLKLYVQKDSNSKSLLANTKSVPKFLKFCLRYYKEHELERKLKEVEIIAEEKALQDKKAKLGIL